MAEHGEAVDAPRLGSDRVGGPEIGVVFASGYCRAVVERPGEICPGAVKGPRVDIVRKSRGADAYIC